MTIGTLVAVLVVVVLAALAVAWVRGDARRLGPSWTTWLQVAIALVLALFLLYLLLPMLDLPARVD
jgi:hypothetical protein